MLKKNYLKIHPFIYALMFFVSVTWVQNGFAERWQALATDGVHDPGMPALSILQQPVEALQQLPPDTSGNKVDWMKAITEGYIQPRSTLKANQPVEMLDSVILMEDTSQAPVVRFPHKSHTLWLDCGNCHDKLFKKEAGATPVNMGKILDGEYCGVCHGAVAFPLTECSRCHSGRKK